MSQTAYKITVSRNGVPIILPVGHKWSWVIRVSAPHRGEFLFAGPFSSRADAIRVAKKLFRMNRDPDVVEKLESIWYEER